MIELHSHLIETGTEDTNKIIRRLKNARRMGVTELLFTPRYNIKTISQKNDQINSKYQEVNQILKDKKIDLSIYLGMEISASKNILQSLEELSKNGMIKNHMLINIEDYKSSVSELSYALSITDFKPIIAHPEYLKTKNFNSKVTKWRHSGAKILINLSSLYRLDRTGFHARSLMRNHLVDFVSLGKKTNMFSLHLMYLTHFISSIFCGRKYTRQIFKNNPINILKMTVK